MWILGIFGTVETSEVSVRVAVNMDMSGWFHDETFISSTFEIPTNALESLTVAFCWLEGVPGALVDNKRDIGAGVTGQVEQHTNNTRIVDAGIGRLTICVFWKNRSFGWSFFCRGVACMEAKGIKYSTNETSLGESEGAVIALLNVNPEKSFG